MSIHSQENHCKNHRLKIRLFTIDFYGELRINLKNWECGTHFIRVGRIKRIKEEFFRVCPDHVWESLFKFFIPFRLHIST